MGNILANREYLDGKALLDFLEYSKKQLDDMTNIHLQTNTFMRNFAKPIINNALDLARKPNGMTFVVEFEQDSVSQQELGIISTTPMDRALNALMFGINSQLNEGHTFISGLGISGEPDFLDPPPITTQEAQEAALGIVAAFLVGSRNDFDNAFEPQGQIGNITNSYFQTIAAIENGGTFNDQSYNAAIEMINTFSKEMSLVKYPGSELKTLNECNLLFASNNFVITKGSLKDISNTSCNNSGVATYKVYTGDGACSKKVVPGGMFIIIPEEDGCGCKKKKRCRSSCRESSSSSSSCLVDNCKCVCRVNQKCSRTTIRPPGGEYDFMIDVLECFFERGKNSSYCNFR